MSNENHPYPYVSNLKFPLELIGMAVDLNPFAPYSSSPRLDMFRSHLSQAVAIDGAEFPIISSGKECEYKNFEMQEGALYRSGDGYILKVIDRYIDSHDRINNTITTVIYKNLDNLQIDYFDIVKYKHYNNKFGFINKITNEHLLAEGNFIEKDTPFCTSPMINDEQYNLGVNANTVYMTSTDLIEDSMVISKSIADKMSNVEIDTISFHIPKDSIPINLYGDEYEYKFIPDIGEYINKDGILCAFKKINDENFIPTMTDNNKNKISYLHDDIIKSIPDAKIIDIDFHYSLNNKDTTSKFVLDQSRKYIENRIRYYKEIVDLYEANQNMKLTSKFNTLVREAYKYLYLFEVLKRNNKFVKKMAFVDKKQSVLDGVSVDITYMKKRDTKIGYKITDRHGTKGIIAKIVPDEEMPIDDYGFRADLMIDACSPTARMNMGQLYEQAITRISEFVRREIEKVYLQGDIYKSYEMLLDYYTDINENYVEIIKENIITEEDIIEHIEYSIKNGIYLNIPPGLINFYDERFPRVVNNLQDEKKKKELQEKYKIEDKKYKDNLILKLVKKWNVEKTPLTFKKEIRKGEFIDVRTKEKIWVGSKYIMLLSKIPEPSSPCIAPISQYGVPVKPPVSRKKNSFIPVNPTRFGEDEIRRMLIDVGEKETSRLMGLQSMSNDGVIACIDTILNAKNFNDIGRIDIEDITLKNSNTMLILLKQILQTKGIKIGIINE